jgi:hypothetical protein
MLVKGQRPRRLPVKFPADLRAPSKPRLEILAIRIQEQDSFRRNTLVSIRGLRCGSSAKRDCDDRGEPKLDRPDCYRRSRRSPHHTAPSSRRAEIAARSQRWQDPTRPYFSTTRRRGLLGSPFSHQFWRSHRSPLPLVDAIEVSHVSTRPNGSLLRASNCFLRDYLCRMAHHGRRYPRMISTTCSPQASISS